jgi:hypothetical protein
VLVDGQLIFSKTDAGRFPIEGEVEDLFAALKPTVKASAAETTAGDPASDQSGGGGRAGMLRRLSDKFRN